MATVALASPCPTTTLDYTVRHVSYGDIGSYSVTIRCQNDALVVHVRNRVVVHMLAWTYRYAADQEELWRGGRLVRYWSTATDDHLRAGEATEVSARVRGDKLVIDGPEGRAEVPAGLLTTNPWNPKILKQRQLIHTTTGAIKRVTVTAGHEEIVSAGGQRVRARKYTISGDLQRELWFDGNGLCVQARFERYGHTVTVTLSRPLESEALLALRAALAQLGDSVRAVSPTS